MIMKRFIIGVIVLMAGIGLAQEPPEQIGVYPDKDALELPLEIPAELPGLAKRMSLDIEEMHVRSLLRLFSKIGDLNIILTPDAHKAGKLTLSLHHIRIIDALEIVLITNKLAKEVRGNIINVMTEGEYQKLYNKVYNDRKIVKTIKLKYARPTGIIDILKTAEEMVKTTSIMPIDSTSTIMVMGVPENIKKVEEIIKGLDVPTETRVFELKGYASISAIKDMLTDPDKPILSKRIGELKVDPRTRQLIMTDTPEALEKAEHLIKILDKPLRQVIIETKMIQITLSDDYRWGVNWEKIFSQTSRWKDVTAVGTFPMTPASARSFTVTKVRRGVSGVEAVVEALKEFGETKIISSPRLMVLDNHSAKFMVGKEEVYVTSTQSVSDAGIVTSEVVEFIEVGVTLSISPTITSDGFIMMHLEPEISDVVDERATALGNVIPIVQTTNVQTDVMVKEGVSVVIAGLIRDEKVVEKRGIPILSSIPLIGGLFGSNRNYVQKTETIIFLTPFIVTGEADASVISKRREMIRKRPKELKPVR